MKKKVFAILIAAILLCAALPFGAVSAAEGEKTYGPLSYVVNGDTVYITDCADDVVEVLIPLEIEGKPVTHITEGAFADCDRMTSITFFRQLGYISEYAFDGCDALTEVHYRGTETEWKQMMLWEGNGNLLRAEKHYELAGDADGNGRLNNRDLGLLQQYVNGFDVEICRDYCDMNGDGKVNNRDLGALQRKVNGVEEVDFRPGFNDVEFGGWEQL